MIDMGGTHDNDDEKLSFVSLSAATERLVRRLGTGEHEDKQKNHDGNSGTASDADNERRAYVDQRLRELSAFERRFGNKGRSGARLPPRK